MHTIAVIGAGQIGETLLAGLLRSGWAADKLVATERRPDRAAQLAEKYRIRMVDNAEAVKVADVLAIAVKPQDAGALMVALGPLVPADKLVVTLCAGLPISFFAKWLPEGTPVVRVMTNTPAFVDQAMTAISAGPHASHEHVDLADRIAYLSARYGEMAAAGGDGIGTALRLIADAGRAPAVVHCFVGMDRTGIVSALTLSLLGVPDETVAADYALSDAASPALQAAHNFGPFPFPSSPPEAMLGFLSELRDKHDSIEAYVKSIGVSDDHIAAMRAHLLT